MAIWQRSRKNAGTTNSRMLVARAPPGAAFEFSALRHQSGSAGSPFSAGFGPMVMIFWHFSNNASSFPHIEILAVEDSIPIRR
jgi:hypothetical protein